MTSPAQFIDRVTGLPLKRNQAANAAVLNAKGEVALLLRDDIPAWCLLGGIMDPGETPEQTLYRELEEETNLDLHQLTRKPEIVVVFEGIHPETNEMIQFGSTFIIYAEDHPLMLGDDGIKIQFFPRDQLPVNTFAYHGELVEKILSILDEGSPLPVKVGFPFTSYAQNYFQHSTSDYTAYHEWTTHPKVMEKRERNALRYDPMPKANHFAASAVIINENNEILLIMRDDMPLWTNIGGNADPGEDFETTMRREVMEEVNLEVDIIRFVGDFFSPVNATEYRHEQIFLCKAKAGQTPVLGDEGTAIQWFATDQLPLNIGPRYQARFAQALIQDAPPVARITMQKGMIDYLQDKNPDDFKSFTGVAEWNLHPRVIEKRLNGQLRFDPFAKS